jgi:hypothetical protein
MESVSNIRILGLRALDQHEMRDSIPNADLTFEPQVPAERGATSHEPATVVAVVLISAAALNGLAAWLLKKRHRKDVTIEVEKKRGDGSSERVAVTVHMSESSTKADVVRAVGERLGIDQSVIGTALGLAQPETTA